MSTKVNLEPTIVAMSQELKWDLTELRNELLSLAAHVERKQQQIEAADKHNSVRLHLTSVASDVNAFASGPLLKRFNDRLTVFDTLLKLG